MIRICHIVPVSFQDYLASRSLDRFVMAMAPVALLSPRYVAQMVAAKSRGAYVVLDNGTPYLGESVPDDELVAAAELVRPDVVVLPDVLHESDITEARIESFLGQYSQAVHSQFMGVVQGRSLSEYEESYGRIARDVRISQIGLPFMGCDRASGSVSFERERLIQTLVCKQLIAQSKPHHLLGFSHSGNIELQRLKRFAFVASCDTSAAYKNAVLGARIEMGREYEKPDIDMEFDAPFELSIAELTVTNAACLDESAR